MRAPLFLAIGLAVGITGAVLFQDSFMPAADSPEERLADLERELARTKVSLAAAEARAPKPEASTQQKLTLGARTIMEDIKDGREVDMNDIYQAAKPALRDLSPIFERLQRKDMRRHHEFILADLTRKYHLTPAQQESLREWQKKKIEADLAVMRAFHQQDSTTLEDMVKAGRKTPPNAGLDSFMEKTLTGQDLTAYKSDRLNQRVEQVQSEADRRVSRLNSVVALDDAQQDQVFALMARSSPEFDPSMQFEGLTGDTAKLDPGQSRDEAILQVLRPDQRQQYENHRAARRLEAQKEFTDVGIRLPDTWDMVGDN